MDVLMDIQHRAIFIGDLSLQQNPASNRELRNRQVDSEDHGNRVHTSKMSGAVI